MDNKKTKFIIIGIILILIIALVVFFMVNKKEKNPVNQNTQNINNSQTDEETDPVPEDEPTNSLKNATITPVIE